MGVAQGLLDGLIIPALSICWNWALASRNLSGDKRRARSAMGVPQCEYNEERQMFVFLGIEVGS